MIKSKFILVTSILNKLTKDNKTKEYIELWLITKKPIRQFKMKERIKTYTRWS